MTTTTGVFGHATAFCTQSARVGDGLAVDHLGSIRRQLQGILVQGGRGVSTTSPLISITMPRLRAWAPPLADNGRFHFADAAPLRSAAVPAEMKPLGRTHAPSAVFAQSRTIAQDLVDEIRKRSGLVLEEIAPLLGTSRRTLQNWKAGEAISAVNERKLRDLAHAICQISVGNDQLTRRRLLDQSEGAVRVYDLLSEGRYETAVALASGSKGARREMPGRGGVRAEIAARLIPAPDIEPIATGVLSTRRLRRGRI